MVGPEVAQQGSLVAPDRLRFDFNSDALNGEQIAAVEEQVNARVAANDSVSWKEVPHDDVKDRADVMQFFGDKYGDVVRVVQIGGDDGVRLRTFKFLFRHQLPPKTLHSCWRKAPNRQRCFRK